MIQATVEVSPKYKVRCTNHLGPIGTWVEPPVEVRAQFATEDEALDALVKWVQHDLQDLHARGCCVLQEERSVEDQVIEYRFTDEPRSLGGLLMYDVELAH